MQNFLRYCGLCESRETSRVLERQQPRILDARWISFAMKGVCGEKPQDFGSDSIRTDQAPDLRVACRFGRYAERRHQSSRLSLKKACGRAIVTSPTKRNPRRLTVRM